MPKSMQSFLSLLALAVVLFAADAGAADEVAADKGTALDAYARGDYATAAKRWRPLAEAGNPEAQFLLGTLYARGQGVQQDRVEAYKWYAAAAAQQMDGASASLKKLASGMSAEELDQGRRAAAALRAKPASGGGGKTRPPPIEEPEDDPAPVDELDAQLAREQAEQEREQEPAQ
jgi:TPR repeat protein